jgi:DNA-binding NarL/FixJ family response regulator
MRVRDGRGAIGELSERPVRVVVLTTFDNDANVQKSLFAGAAGFLLKDAPADRLVAAIRAAAAGDAVLAPSVVRRLVRDLESPRPASPGAPGALEAL